MKKTQDMFSDPNVAAQAEAKFEHMQRVGNDQLKKNAKNSMEQVMDAMNDPTMKEEMAKMLKDPNFKENLAKMAKSPEFQSYIEAMQDMLKDPSTKKKIESVSESIRAQL
jgi:molecular chaperone DnaK (HSP70)